MAVTFAPDAEYVALDTGEWIYIVAKELAQQTIEKCNLRERKRSRLFPGTKLEHATFAHPFLDRQILGVLGDYVTMDTGTGAVHTAPAHGADDFNTGVKYGLDLHSNVDDAGILRNGLPEYEGQQVFKANPLIVELLKSRGVLLGYEKIEHSYPHCWRCHNPDHLPRHRAVVHLDGRQTAGGRNAAHACAGRDQEGEVGPGVGRRAHLQHGRRPSRLVHLAPARLGCAHRDVPVRGLQRVRRRSGGPQAGGRICSRAKALTPGTSTRRSRFCRQARSARSAARRSSARRWTSSTCGSSRAAARPPCWATSPDFPGLPTCTSKAAISIADGSSLPCCARSRPRARRPIAAARPRAGRSIRKAARMSKSLGNTVDPVEIADKLGAEIVRLWVASVDFREDVMASDELMQRIADSYRKIRNTFRYILGNLDGFDPATDVVPFARDASARSVHPAARGRGDQRMCASTTMPSSSIGCISG